jgi:hypothetical protein
MTTQSEIEANGKLRQYLPWVLATFVGVGLSVVTAGMTA